MKKTLQFLKLFIVCTVILICSVSPAAADSIDGLDIDVSFDKDNYSVSDDITVNVTITNTNDVSVSNVSFTHEIPEGYLVESALTSSKDLLNPGESFQVTAILQSSIAPESSVQANAFEDVPETEPQEEEKDDSSKLILYILLGGVGICVLIIVAVVVINLVKKHKKKSDIAMMLCIVMLGSTVMPANASPINDKSSLTVSCPLPVDNMEITFNGVLEYDSIKTENSLLSIDIDDMFYDTTSTTYYVVEPMNSLTGSLLLTEGVSSLKCTVTDVNGNLLLENDITPSNFWSLSDFSMIVGMNHVNVSVQYENGVSFQTDFKVNNICSENMKNLDVDMEDSDDDGVLNFIEFMYHTDPEKADTDEDGLSDYYEMAVLGTSPILPDTDGNGVLDSNEDADNDQLTNLEEIEMYSTSSICADSDGDGLSDYREINETLTDPNNSDTDEDGGDDLWEIENGFDPLVFNDDLPRNEDEVVPDNVSVSSEGEVYVTQLLDHAMINENTPGYMGQPPVYVEIEEGYSADLIIEYDPSLLGEEDSPELYYYDEATQCYEKIDSSIDENGRVAASVEKSGVYVLLNHRFVDDVWQNDIFRPSDFVENGVIDAVFVIDRSYSMYDNDPNAIRKLVTKEFINKLRDGIDRAAIIQFTTVAELLMPLSYDKEALCNAVDSIVNSDGGGCAGTDETAGTNGSAGIREALTALNDSTADYKYIIFLTDGSDTTVSEDYGDEFGTTGLTGEAKSKGIVIHTVGLVGNNTVDIDLLKRVAAGTGGNYYLATVGADAENNSELIKIYDNIESITIDRHLDSNNDGISDYYTKLICEGTLTTGTGVSELFGTADYETVQQNADLDGDGILNGEELVIIENENGVFVKLVSYPYLKDSDGDSMDDPYERLSEFSPLKKNGYAENSDVLKITNSEYYMSDAYLDIYNNSVLERGSVYIGNAFFGTTLDQTILYRKMLIDYFAEIDQNLMSSATIQNYRAVAGAFLNESFRQIAEGIMETAETGTEEELTLQLGDFVDLVKKIQGNLDLLDQFEIDELLTKLLNFNDTMQKDTLQIWMTDLQKHLDSIPGIIPNESRDYWIKNLTEWSDEMADYRTKYGILEEKINLRVNKIKGFTDKISTLGDILMVIDWGRNAWDAHLTFCDITASLQTVEDNVYILDCILATTDNMYLRSAAMDLKYYINSNLSQQTREFMMAMDQAEGVITTAALDLLHGKVISALGVPGLVIELVRAFGNVVFDLDDMSKAAAETVALAASADVLGVNLMDHLNAGHAMLYDERWIAYADYSHDMYITILNLAQLRKMAENKYAEWDKKDASRKICSENTTFCENVIIKYNERYLSFCLD